MRAKPPQPNADTIAAIATAQGRGGIGVVRISGPQLKTLARGILGKLPAARHATYGEFLDENGDPLDQGVALFFPAPRSYTGEDVLELQGHGGSAVLQLLLQRCLALGARLAQPGEFTQRAFLNDKLDLAQAESVADLIEANTAEAARSAMRSLHGEFSAAIRHMVDELIHLRMLVEAMLDFPEEEVDAVDLERRNALLNSIRASLQHTLGTAKQGSLLREGAHVVIAGQPNVGKSSLLNRLAGEEIALVSDIPGTTRDVIRQAIQIRGVPLHIMDTAGLRKSEDAVESMGIARAHQTMHRADLILLLLDASKGLTAQDEAILASLPTDIPRLLVFNKADLLDGSATVATGVPFALVSAKTGAGMEELRGKLLEAAGWREQESGAFMARERHLRALALAQTHLEQAQAVLASAELFAEELRLAQYALNEITGEFTSDDLLGEIFSRFCIGK
ncbi:tRNA uridine-5-carboxymethylaminomethyl(34) synthesis GTPase MnmE [Candidatus Ferrigenium straubiae]|jgi:tRNA modification GTPase|uniref:tRNA uridine-5-carboxymethylaminomethyl(34) synthesis GTPase MnmE n=1 Tax=Candidatus Ferrigenium straubiae TaxID=2919506 RepID=UPI003F4AE11F